MLCCVLDAHFQRQGQRIQSLGQQPATRRKINGPKVCSQRVLT